jgi:hypothetical protein
MKVSLRRGRTKVIGFAAVDGRRARAGACASSKILLAESAAIKRTRKRMKEVKWK